ncbi:FMN-binding negative transcriptional regulator [Lentibacillus amyloliquefaciens]|uniref:Transcriptional regulator n=1 Tax=Lentibacillus amyloliquefaciens TaxID=1472767 RepID=A0A0U3WFL7_9BACI|nr:FMN-binding negative transcriptional regulator [Lentibacillus amyloliquefaciens]ALX48623.1 transcriptional regulator [Lentibacillus amyloliquefaciens]
MYIPKHFEIKDEEVIYDIIEENSFATLFSQHQGHPYATHLPLILDKDKRYLYGHFAKPNKQWKDIEEQEVLAVFQGPHCYISSSWYETDKAVPTWNYVSAHVYGKVDIIDGEEMMDSLHQMVLKYEDPNSSYQWDQLDAHFLEGQAKGIVGFKIKIDKIEGKAKLSQNHSAERLKLVISQIEQSTSEDEREIASHMQTILRKKA